MDNFSPLSLDMSVTGSYIDEKILKKISDEPVLSTSSEGEGFHKSDSCAELQTAMDHLTVELFALIDSCDCTDCDTDVSASSSDASENEAPCEMSHVIASVEFLLEEGGDKCQWDSETTFNETVSSDTGTESSDGWDLPAGDSWMTSALLEDHSNALEQAFDHSLLLLDLVGKV